MGEMTECSFNVPVNNYGHAETSQLTYPHVSWAGLGLSC